MVAIPQPKDPTLEAMKRAYMENNQEDRRNYVGASSVGKPCARAIWYDFNGYPKPPHEVDTLWRFADGHRTEALVIERLRMVKGLQVWDTKPDGTQFGFSALEGKFKGHIDGVILGLLQAPKTPHVLEVKCTSKLKEFQKAKQAYGEKRALQKWNEVYFGQAQLYMHYLKLGRHYTVVASEGGREVDSCRTEYQPEVAEQLIDKADKIISSKTEPMRVSDKPDFFVCKMCEFRKVCHG